MDPAGGEYLVVTADDFGRSSAVNRAVAEAHEQGILTAASIMTGGKAFTEAVLIARRNADLSVGLHLTLCDGRAVAPPESIPDLVDRAGHFDRSPARAWLRYFSARLLPQIETEIAAQFDRLQGAGVQPTHVDGHHHLHMHPAVFAVVCRIAAGQGVRWVRIPAEPFRMVITSGHGALLRLADWAVFGILGRSHRRRAGNRGLRAADRSYGLARTGRLDERYLLNVLERGTALQRFFRIRTRRPMPGGGNCRRCSHRPCGARLPPQACSWRAIATCGTMR